MAGAVASALLLTAAVGCADGPKAADDQVDYAAKARKADAAPGSGGAAKLAGQFDEMPTPPADAQYTIHCQDYAGPDHQEVARRARDLLRANTPLGKWYVVHGDQQSTLYYGFYRTVDRTDRVDGAEGQRAINDLDAIRTLHDNRGDRLFPASLPVPIDSPDPAANPKWDITRTGAYWSLDVATFKDTPDRKLRAVEAVADARRLGYDAYYYHGPHTSEVCIGAWPEKAAIEIDTAMQNIDPTRPLLVTPTPLAPGGMAGLDPNIQTVAPRVDPVDPSMIAAIGTWQTHAVNGYVRMKPDPVTHQATNVPMDRAFLFKVPAAGTGADGGSLDTANAAPDTAAPVAPPAEAGSGQLRSLDDAH